MRSAKSAGLLFIAFFLLSNISFPQNTEKQDEKAEEANNFGIHFKGFIKSDYWYDSRQVLSSREDIFLFYPLNKASDAIGNDLNARPSFNFSAVTSRLTGVISGPDAFGAKTSGVLEADFSGVTNTDINGFRLRHAYGKLRWEKTELLFGQYWHPMFVTEVFPNVISLNTGAPFQPFIRNPQIAITRFFNKYSLNFTLLSQRDNSSMGPGPNPVNYSPDYIRNSMIPNAHLQLMYKTDEHVWGLAADYKVLQPKFVNDRNEKTSETLGSVSFMAYYKYVRNSFLFSTKSIYGQNLTEHLMMGGYAQSTYDSLTGKETYTPTNHANIWCLLAYGKNIRYSLFTGFSKNLGTSHPNTGLYYARGHDIDYLYRLAPSVTFTSNKVQICTELEYTAAAYGTPDSKGRVKDAVETGNFRLLLTFFYFF
jgi:hypothetical protein